MKTKPMQSLIAFEFLTIRNEYATLIFILTLNNLKKKTKTKTKHMAIACVKAHIAIL